MKIEQLHTIFTNHPVVCTDTRKITKNCMFFALKGDNFNGNKYASEALKKGASYAIVDEKEFAHNDSYILVDDVLTTLQNLAKYHRHNCNAKIIALTGSNGKTTTKELLNSVLVKKFKTIATVGNLNNHIGVPLTLLSIQPDTEIAVVEMGANHLNEIDFLCSIALPDYGYITNFGKAHIEGFGSEEGVVKGKSELYDFLIKNNKPIFLNADDPKQNKILATYINKFGFSTNDTKYFTISFLGAKPFVSLKAENTTITTNLVGSYNFTNCCAAFIIGKYFTVDIEKIKEALENYMPNNNRSQIIEKNNYHILLDAYNANPSSMTAAIENFATINNGVKIVILGDMFELGPIAEHEHQAIADLATNKNFNEVILVGQNFFKSKTNLKKFESYDELENYLKNNELPKSNILIKGSRGMALERVVNLL